jgi:hypothetical protein
MCSTGTCVDVIRVDVKCVGVRYVCVCVTCLDMM